MSKNLVSKDNIVSILKQIRPNILTKIDNKDITENQKEQLVKTNIIDNTSSNSSFLSNNGKYNNIDLIKIDTVINKTNNIYNDTFKINKVDKKWTNKTSPPKPLIYFSAQEYINKIYCIAGYLGSNSQDFLQIYDIETDVWSYGTSVPTTMSYHDSVISGNIIYVTGGRIRSTLNVVRGYDIDTDTWSVLRPLNYARYGHVSEIYDNKIYSISGYGASGVVEIYSIAEDTITYGTNIPTSRCYFSSVLYDDKIYTGAGEGGSVFEVYDIKENKWSTLETSIYNSYDNDMVLYKDKIYFMGGRYDSRSIIEYDIKNKKWSTFQWMKNARKSGRCLIHNKKLYCIGGDYSILPLETFQFPYINYDINLSSSTQNKLDCISDIGLGNKILSDNGEYIDIPKGYRFMEPDEVSSIINKINL